jgi:hypothetical protein
VLKSILLFVTCLILWGCQLPKAEPLIPTTPGQALAKTIIKTDWIITASILGVALSVIAWMNGSKTAIGVMAGCGVAIWMQLTVVRYAHVLAWVGLVFAVGIMLWTVFVKNRALKEIIMGVQKYKAEVPSIYNNASLPRCLSTQKKTTQKIVSSIKNRVLGPTFPELEKEKQAAKIKGGLPGKKV